MNFWDYIEWLKVIKPGDEVCITKTGISVMHTPGTVIRRTKTQLIIKSEDRFNSELRFNAATGKMVGSRLTRLEHPADTLTPES